SPAGFRPLAGPAPGRCASGHSGLGRASSPPEPTAPRPDGPAERPAVTDLGGSGLSAALGGDHAVQLDQELAQLREALLAEHRGPVALGLRYGAPDHRDE